MGILWRFIVLFVGGAFLVGITGRTLVEILKTPHAVAAFGVACAVVAGVWLLWNRRPRHRAV